MKQRNRFLSLPSPTKIKKSPPNSNQQTQLNTFTKSKIKNLKPGQFDIKVLQQYNQVRLDQFQSMMDVQHVERVTPIKQHIVVKSDTDQPPQKKHQLNKGHVLNRMQDYYRKIDPQFKIKHYISEHQHDGDKYRKQQYLKSCDRTLIEAKIESLQRQIKTPLQIKKRGLSQTYTTQQSQDKFNQQLLMSPTSDDKDEIVRINQKSRQERWQQMKNRQTENYPSLKNLNEPPDPKDRYVEYESKNILTTLNCSPCQKNTSPLKFLFWKFNNLVQYSYDSSSLKMKDLIDLYCPPQLLDTEESDIQRTEPAPPPTRTTDILRKKSSRTGFIDEQFYMHRPQTAYQREMLQRMNTTMYDSIEEVEDSVRRQIKQVKGYTRKRNDFVALNRKWDRQLRSHKQELRDEIGVMSFIQDKAQLQSFIGGMKKDNPHEDYSAYDFLLQE